jgi:hypothetical protein
MFKESPLPDGTPLNPRAVAALVETVFKSFAAAIERNT